MTGKMEKLADTDVKDSCLESLDEVIAEAKSDEVRSLVLLRTPTDTNENEPISAKVTCIGQAHSMGQLLAVPLIDSICSGDESDHDKSFIAGFIHGCLSGMSEMDKEQLARAEKVFGFLTNFRETVADLAKIAALASEDETIH